MYDKAKWATEICLSLTKSKSSINCKMQLLTSCTRCNVQL